MDVLASGQGAEPVLAGSLYVDIRAPRGTPGKEQEPQPVRGQRWYVSDGIRPVRESKPVELDRETVRKMHALRYLAKDAAARYDDNAVVFNRWCVNGYGLAPDAFLDRANHHAAGYYLSPDFKPDAAALAEAERQQAASTPEALRDRHRQHVQQFYTQQEWEGVQDSRRAAAWAALEVVALIDADGVERWRQDWYAEDPDPPELLPVA